MDERPRDDEKPDDPFPHKTEAQARKDLDEALGDGISSITIRAAARKEDTTALGAWHLEAKRQRFYMALAWSVVVLSFLGIVVAAWQWTLGKDFPSHWATVLSVVAIVFVARTFLDLLVFWHRKRVSATIRLANGVEISTEEVDPDNEKSVIQLLNRVAEANASSTSSSHT